MAKRKTPKTWAEQIADLDDPAPKDLDLEEHSEHFGGGKDSESSSGEDGAVTAREHYVDVGKSKLRKPKEISLGPQYTGSKISRNDLLADESDDDPFHRKSSENAEIEDDAGSATSDEDVGGSRVNEGGETDSEEAFESGGDNEVEEIAYKGRKSTESKRDKKSLQQEDEEGDSSSEEDEDMKVLGNGINGDGHESENTGDEDSDSEMEDEDNTSSGDSDESVRKKHGADDRAELRKMMAEEQKIIISSISKAAKADIAKGKAIKHQRSTFDSLLNTRIRLQKALIATNSMSAGATSAENTKADKDVIQAAEQAALSLWNTLDNLRQSLQNPAPEERPTSNKRPFSATVSTPTETLWTRIQHHESASLPHRRATLSKWSSRVHLSSTLKMRNALSAATAQQPLTSVLDQQLSAPNNARLLARARVPRSCAPVQAAKKAVEDKNIYDDADFYTLLLRELVDQRMSSSHQTPTTITNPAPVPILPLKAPKIRKQVDTKASKGRKMRYTVHEKLQNFMAPDDRGDWGNRQVRELFGSLLGAKVRMDEDEINDKEGDGSEEGVKGLRFFGA